MKTNDLKKGDMVLLRNGWKARIEDNMRGQTRLATVYGDFTEMGSVYSHDITHQIVDEYTGLAQITGEGILHLVEIEHTDKQRDLQEYVESLGF